MERQCAQCNGPFAIDAADTTFYSRIGVPAPTLCPVCRQRRRMIFRNFKTLYRRPSDRSGAQMLSMYHADVPFPVYTTEEWWADDWDARIFGRKFDFSRPFFDQFAELLRVVPRFNFMNTQSERCEYSNFAWRSKDCYMIFGCVEDEECAYGHIVWESKDSVDNLYLYRSELCYECVDCTGSYKLLYSQECDSCTDSIGLFDCRGCTNCIGCVGLKQASYHIFNQPVTKEAYAQFVADHPLTDPATVPMIMAKRDELRRTLPQRHFFGLQNTDVSGNHIYNARNVHDSFDVRGGESSRYAYTTRNVRDCYDVAFSPDMELSYEALTSLGANRVFFSHLAHTSSDTYYSDACFTVRNVFGCAGLKGGEYCILNKQYAKEEYEELRTRIVEHMRKTGEWGEFFPAKLSSFAYNESIAQEYYPLSPEEASAQGFAWRDALPHTTGQETIAYDALPADPEDLTDDLLRHILACDACGRNYRFAPQELRFYRRMGLPLPRQCFNCRHARRMAMRNVRKLWDGACAQCGTAFRTSYDPAAQSALRLCCDVCYQQATGERMV